MIRFTIGIAPNLWVRNTGTELVKRPGRPRLRWKEGIKLEFKEIGIDGALKLMNPCSYWVKPKIKLPVGRLDVNGRKTVELILQKWESM